MVFFIYFVGKEHCTLSQNVHETTFYERSMELKKLKEP